MTKSTCTPRRKALAMRFKKGDIHKDNVGEAGLTSEADSTPMPKLSELVKTNEDKWIKKAVDPNHTGYCTPMTKSTCTPRRKALAQRFKKGLENENHKVQTRSYTTANDLAQDPNIVRDPEVPGP